MKPLSSMETGNIDEPLSAVRRDCLYNIGQANLRLRRFATAILYFEEYLTMPGADRQGGEAGLAQAQQGAGVPGAEIPTAEAPLSMEQTREMFDEAVELYGNRQYRRAIIRFERVRQQPDIGEDVRRDCLYNIGQANLRLRRFATAIPYFEEYLTMPGADREGGEAGLAQAQQGLSRTR
jgi:outer membrane protein assembly factor BamD (BamD/ComL family)